MALHPEEEKMFAELKRELGDDAVKGTHPHELDKATADAANIMIVTMDAGNLEQATDMAIACNDTVARNPKVKFIFGINGCRDDPREIDQIPEARASLRTLRTRMPMRPGGKPGRNVRKITRGEKTGRPSPAALRIYSTIPYSEHPRTEQ